MSKLILLTDYLGFFGSKNTAVPYRSGMDKEFLKHCFHECGLEIQFSAFADIDFRDPTVSRNTYLYTSSEDNGYHYKSYIEDIVLGLEDAGARVLPPYRFLRANNNKVFMEILRDQSGLPGMQTIRSRHFGTFEELEARLDSCPEKSVIKSAEGAMSKGVLGANNQPDLISVARKISDSRNFQKDVKDYLRRFKYPGYRRTSIHRRKFVVQNLIPSLENDWKVLCLGDKFFVLRRANRDNDFRASGSGKFEFRRELPDGMLNFAREVYLYFNVPNLSVDVGFNGEFHIIEFQAVYFGTTTLEKSEFHWEYVNGEWEIVEGKCGLEREYANSIAWYLKRHG